MSITKRTARRVREPGEKNANIYRRADGKFEVGYRDSDGVQRWKSVAGGISAARAERDRIFGARASGQVVRPNPKLRFGEAREAWLEHEVVHLRSKTQESYRDAANRLPWTNRRMDSLGADDVAAVVGDLRARGLSEWTIAGTVKAASAIFRFARRQLRWSGANPVDDLSPAQRPKLSQAPKRRLHSART